MTNDIVGPLSLYFLDYHLPVSDLIYVRPTKRSWMRVAVVYYEQRQGAWLVDFFRADAQFPDFRLGPRAHTRELG